MKLLPYEEVYGCNLQTIYELMIEEIEDLRDEMTDWARHISLLEAEIDRLEAKS
jgi:hypothetical protein